MGPNAGGSIIQGNTIGLNVDNDPVGNGYSGITMTAAGQVYVGTPQPNQGNVISGNGIFGISILRIVPTDPAPANALIENNFIGTDATGTLARGNGQAGISVSGSLHHIGGPGGGANVIAFNGAQGISVNGSAGATRVAISHNSIRNNTGLGIDLGADGITANDDGDADAGVNNTQNFPVIVSATNNPGPNTVVTVDLSSFTAGSSNQLEFFANASCDPSGHGEGESVVGTFGGIVASSSPRAFVLSGAIPAGSFITATATDANNSTSEFSACVEVDPQTVVSNTNDSGPGSLRAAIATANSTPGRQTINFNIPGAARRPPAVIALVSALPRSSPRGHRRHDSPGYVALPLIELTGTAYRATASVGPLIFRPSTIRGLTVTGFTSGIWLEGTQAIPREQLARHQSRRHGVGNIFGVCMANTPNNVVRRNVITGNIGNGVVMSNSSAAGSRTIGSARIRPAPRIVRVGPVFCSKSPRVLAASGIMGNLSPATPDPDRAALGSIGARHKIQNNTIGLNLTGRTALANGADSRRQWHQHPDRGQHHFRQHRRRDHDRRIRHRAAGDHADRDHEQPDRRQLERARRPNQIGMRVFARQRRSPSTLAAPSASGT